MRRYLKKAGDTMVNELIHDKDFFKKMMVIAIPVALQNLISSSLNMVDTVMIGQLGEESINAVGLANQFFFVLVLLLFGISSGASIFIAQFGKEGYYQYSQICWTIHRTWCYR